MGTDIKEIKTLKEELSDLKMAVASTNKSVDRLVFILNNDEGTGRAGLVAEVKNLDKDVKELKKKSTAILNLGKLPMPSIKVRSLPLAWLAGFFGLS